MASDFDTWKAEAMATQSVEYQPKLPFHVLCGEAVDVASFFAKYWKTVKDGKTVIRYGLETAVKDENNKFTKDTGEEILSLQRAAQDARARYVFAVNADVEANPSERARFVVGEISAALEWHFNDDVQDENDEKLATAHTEHDDHLDTMDGLALALDDYAHLAEPFRKALDGRGGFSSALIDEAKELAKTLRERPQTPITMTPDAKAALAIRNQIANLLYGKMNVVRSAARYVYRNQPEIVREVTSAFERRRRAEARRAASKKKVEKTP